MTMVATPLRWISILVWAAISTYLQDEQVPTVNMSVVRVSDVSASHPVESEHPEITVGTIAEDSKTASLRVPPAVE
ncbi:hypothetical protein [Candidatus Magnetobacterium casense]|uniref:Secreted protein n=1 Tax=Candidatus Magnetobacterium casense TaxID=1455061 RepID=A0ABS6S4S4_9BACT|nr:hypothetical protein [Candidatus Magnetobacterium casensis]MBV6343645.1 hypothetical protein [Candidatus Magnetobacterium casensis]